MIKTKKLIPLPRLLKKAEKVFNSYVRKRDEGLRCISCDNGGVDHAGHYLNQGQHSLFRFDETNVNGQCVSCNLFRHGNLIHYRKGLVKRYGLEAVEFLESQGSYKKKWSRTELENIIKTYASKTN